MNDLRVKDTKMRCPHCGKVFCISFSQQFNNQKFKCPHCKRYNYGSVEKKDGVLIGLTFS